MTKLNVLGFLRALLNRRDWVYLLSLLVPLVVYNLALKAASVASIPGLAPTFDLIRSDVFFNLGYALFWIGLFAVVRGRGPLRRVVVVLFHVVTILVIILSTSAYQYFRETGATLDYGIIALWLPELKKVVPVLGGSAPLWAWLLLFAVLFYAALGPSLVARAVGRWRGWPERSRSGAAESSFSGSLGPWLLPLGLLLLAFGSGWLSLLIGARSTDYSSEVSVSFVRAPFVNLVLTGAKEAMAEENTPQAEAISRTVEHPAAGASLAPTPQTEKRNVVLIHLESTRERSVTPYNEDLNTTPFLNELAKDSLLIERAYVGSIPRSFMSSIAVNCGIQAPAHTDEDDPGRMPVPCLADLLEDQGYNTALFSSNADKYGDSATIDWGYEKAFAPPEPGVPPQHWSMAMDTERFAHTAFYGYEEDILLEPSENWLEEHKDAPFIVEYLMNTGHDEYNCLDTRYGSEDFAQDDLLNHYLNCLRLQDIFLQNLFDQYKELGLYDNTIFVIFGDHGEGLGEHGRFLHGDTIWEEGLRVPLIIHAPGWFEGGERVQGLSNHTDVLPTVLEMLGYEVKDGEYSGYSLLREPPEDRTLMFSCISHRECLASIKGNEKYIYHYGNQPEEVYDLSEDPFEEHNLAEEYSTEELERRREELFAWLSRIYAEYYGHDSVSEDGHSEENTGQRASRSGGQPSGSTVGVGQPLTVGDVEWTVTGAYPADRLTSYVDGRTKRGNFVVVDFLFKNNSDEGLTLSSESPVLFDGSGRKFEFDTDTYLYIEWPKNMFRFGVIPGTSREGQIIFKVPPDASQFQLQLGEENPFTDKSGYVNLGF